MVISTSTVPFTNTSTPPSSGPGAGGAAGADLQRTASGGHVVIPLEPLEPLAALVFLAKKCWEGCCYGKAEGLMAKAYVRVHEE